VLGSKDKCPQQIKKDDRISRAKPSKKIKHKYSTTGKESGTKGGKGKKKKTAIDIIIRKNLWRGLSHIERPRNKL